MTRKATNVPAKPSNRAQIERDDCGPNPKPKPPIPICQRKRQGPRLRSAGPLSPSMMGQRLRKKFIPAWRGRSRTWSCLSVGIPPDGHVSECQQRRGEEDTHSISQLCSTYYANTKESNNRAQHHDQTKSAKDRLREERVSP